MRTVMRTIRLGPVEPSLMRGLLLALFAEPLIMLFAKADPEMQRLGALCIRLQCLALPAHSWVAVVNMLCAGLGRAGGAVLLAELLCAENYI